MSVTQLFSEDLLKGEEILWTGQPETKVLFTKADFFIIPFGLLWTGLLITFIKNDISKERDMISLFFTAPFLLIGLYLIFGRFIYKIIKKKRTYYAVTNKRVLILTKMFGRNVQVVFIDTIPSINVSTRAGGIGSVRFGTPNPWSPGYGNTGMDFFTSFYGGDVPAFYDIKDAQKFTNW